MKVLGWFFFLSVQDKPAQQVHGKIPEKNKTKNSKRSKCYSKCFFFKTVPQIVPPQALHTEPLFWPLQLDSSALQLGRLRHIEFILVPSSLLLISTSAQEYLVLQQQKILQEWLRLDSLTK